MPMMRPPQVESNLFLLTCALIDDGFCYLYERGHAMRADTSRLTLWILCAKRGFVAGVVTGNADTNLVTLADRKRCSGDGCFECRFLGTVVVLRRAVVEHRP